MKQALLIASACAFACTPCAAIDLNYNGLSDAYESIYFDGPTDPYADSDGDGVSNYEEMVWGTSPTDAVSKVTAPVLVLTGTDLALTWYAAPYRMYELQATTNLLTWQTLTNGAVGHYLANLADTAPASRCFYRLLVTLNSQDSNGDGIADWEEALWQSTFGQLPAHTDIDGDGLPDSEELLQGRTPRKKDHPAVGLVLFTPLER